MPLRIAFDLDGVLADMDSELMRQSKILFGESVTGRLPERAEDGNTAVAPDGGEGDSDDPHSSGTLPVIPLNLTRRQERRLWQHLRSIDNFWEGLDEIEPGAVRRLASLAVDRRWEIIFLTKRPETAGATAQMQTQRWLESKGFTLPSVFVVQGSRGRIASSLGLDFVVDDRPENCLDVVVDSESRAILVWRAVESQPPTATQRLGIRLVASVAECLEMLIQLDSTPTKEPGVVSRVMRLLGRKAPAQ